MFTFHASIASKLATDKPTGGISCRVTNARISHSSSMNGSPASSSSLWILSVQIWTHSAQPRWALGSDKSYSL